MAKPIDADLTGKVAIVTGANTGIGKEVARNLGRFGATVVMACRSRERGDQALRELAADVGDRFVLKMVDLSSQKSIRSFASQITEQFDRLDILVNNAGIWPTERHLSVDGIEMTWATNVLGYFLLTNELLDLLQASAPARVVNVASAFAGGLDLSDPQFETRPFKGGRAYSQSKQANRMLTWTLAERMEEADVTANAVHPGGVGTELGRDHKGVFGFLMNTYFRFLAKSAQNGADTATWLAASSGAEGVSGKFWTNRKSKRRTFYDVTAMKSLWDMCERMTAEK